MGFADSPEMTPAHLVGWHLRRLQPDEVIACYMAPERGPSRLVVCTERLKRLGYAGRVRDRKQP